MPGLSLYLQLKVDDSFCSISNYFKINEYDRMDAPIVSGCLYKLYLHSYFNSLIGGSALL